MIKKTLAIMEGHYNAEYKKYCEYLKKCKADEGNEKLLAEAWEFLTKLEKRWIIDKQEKDLLFTIIKM